MTLFNNLSKSSSTTFLRLRVRYISNDSGNSVNDGPNLQILNQGVIQTHSTENPKKWAYFFSSSTFEEFSELPDPEFASKSRIYNIYERSKGCNVPFTENSAAILLRYFLRDGMLEESLSLSSEVEMTDVRVCNCMISLLLETRRIDDAIKVLDEMLQLGVKPDSVTENISLGYALSRERCGKETADLVLKFGERKVFPNSFQLTKLITRLCKSEETGVAWDVFWGLIKLGGRVETASCNALLTGLGRDEDFERMNELRMKMKEVGIWPDVITFGILIKHMCKSGRIDEAMELFGKMSYGEENDKAVVKPNVVICNMLFDGLCKIGRQEEGGMKLNMAYDIFKKMEDAGLKPDVVTYNTLMDGFCTSMQLDKAYQIFNKMKEAGIKPDVVTYNTLIDSFCRNMKLDSAYEMLKEMEELGVKSDVITHNILINGFCMSKKLDMASEIFKKMEDAGLKPDVVTYNTLMDGFCRCMQLDKAYEIFDKMKEAGIKADVVTYNTLERIVRTFMDEGESASDKPIVQFFQG